MPTDTGDLDLQAAADQIGVHYQTAYRWVRTGRLPSHKVNGRYTIRRSDLDTFVAARSAPATTPPSPRRVAGAAVAMHQALVNGDEADARQLARSLVDQGTPVIDLIAQTIVPPLRQIGQDWHDGNISIWVEHRASAIVERVLGDVIPNPRGRRRGTAMVAAVTGDRHSLATTMAAVALREDHWHVHHLGADMPPDDLVDFCAEHDVDIAVITLTNPEAAETAQAAADRLSAIGSPTIVGAPGRTLEQLLDEARSALASSR